MPKFDSPIGSKNIQGPALRDFNVPDESGFAPPMQQAQRPHQHAPSQFEGPPVFDENAMKDFQSRIQPPAPPQMREMNNLEQEFLSAKKAKREGKERLSDGARRRIEMLIEMTRTTKSIDINGTTFALQVLRSVEVRDALTAAADYDGTVQFSFEYSKQLLARSLTIIAGVAIEQFLTSNDLEVKLSFVEELPQPLFTRLYDEYIAMDTESRDKFGIKTDAQVKELVDDLKK